MDPRLEELCTPTKMAERATILASTVPPYVHGAGWDVNSKHYSARRNKDVAEQEQNVVDKRDLLNQLSNMLREFKADVEPKVEAINTFIQDNDLEDFVNFESYGYIDITAMTECDPIDVALNWAASDHSC